MTVRYLLQKDLTERTCKVKITGRMKAFKNGQMKALTSKLSLIDSDQSMAVNTRVTEILAIEMPISHNQKVTVSPLISRLRYLSRIFVKKNRTAREARKIVLVATAGNLGKCEFAMLCCSLLQYHQPVVVLTSISEFWIHHSGFSKKGVRMQAVKARNLTGFHFLINFLEFSISSFSAAASAGSSFFEIYSLLRRLIALSIYEISCFMLTSPLNLSHTSLYVSSFSSSVRFSNRQSSSSARVLYLSSIDRQHVPSTSD